VGRCLAYFSTGEHAEVARILSKAYFFFLSEAASKPHRNCGGREEPCCTEVTPREVERPVAEVPRTCNLKNVLASNGHGDAEVASQAADAVGEHDSPAPSPSTGTLPGASGR